MSQPGISVVICTYNGSSRLEPVVSAIQNQTGIEAMAVEVVLVDNASTDGTAEFAQKLWTSKTMELRIVREERPGVHIARDTGYKSARYDFICWVDDDNILSPHYLALSAELMGKFPHAAVCGGNGQPVDVTGRISKPDWIPKGWGSHGCGQQGMTEGLVSAQRQYVYGAGSTMRRAALDELHGAGFKPIIASRDGASLDSGEDLEVCFALRFLGWQIIQSPRLTFDHFMPPQRFTWDYCVRLFRSFGRASAIQNLYFMFLGHGFKFRLKQSWPGVLLTVFYNRVAARRKERGSERENDPETIKRVTVQGRVEELNLLYTDGRLKKYFQQIHDFYQHCTPVRRRREAQIKSAGAI